VPEGDTIHHLARTLRPLLEGKRIDGAVRGYGPWRRGEIEPAVGHVVESVEARGKNLLVHLDGGLVFWSHLGIDGYWRRVGAERRAPEEETLRLTVGGEQFALFKAAEASVLRENDLTRVLGDLGPDLLAEGFDPSLAARRAIARPGAIADVLLDQGVAAGIGNVYKSESLYIRRIHPWDTLTDEAALTGLYELNARLLRQNLGRPQRITTSGAARRMGPFWVYDRTGRACLTCGEPIRSRRQGQDARMTYWCPRCQPPR
jgi:endonuclease-8